MEQQPITVLLIEDNPGDAQLVRRSLKKASMSQFIVTEVQRLSDALDKLGFTSFDIVLLDLELPDSFGADTFREMMHHYPDIPIILLTGNESNELGIQLVNEGAQDYLIKGTVGPQLMERAIQYAIQRKKIGSQLKHAMEIQRTAKEYVERVNNQLMSELQQARAVQGAILPKSLPTVPDLQLAAQFIPMEQIGGDLYDIVLLEDGKLAFLLVDVTGHGVAGALLSFMVSGLFKNFVHAIPYPGFLCAKLNSALYGSLPQSRYVSLFFGIYDTNNHKLTYASAGHPDVYVLCAKSEKIIPLSSTTRMLGIFSNQEMEFVEAEYQLKVGDKMVLCTDGILEAADLQRKPLSDIGVKAFLDQNRKLPIDELLNTLCQHALQHTQKQTFEDDVTLVGFEVTASSQSDSTERDQ